MPDPFPNSYIKLPKFAAQGQPDLILRLKGVDDLEYDLPVHSEVLKVYSSVLRDVARGTLSRVIPLSADDALCWHQSLTALYCVVDGLPDDGAWKYILVRADVKVTASPRWYPCKASPLCVMTRQLQRCSELAHNLVTVLCMLSGD